MNCLIYICDIWSKNFVKKTNVPKHMEIHVEVKSFPICHKMFTKKVDLEGHSIAQSKKRLKISKLENTETNRKEKVDVTQSDENKARIALLIAL